jgi:hypothetical protein
MTKVPPSKLHHNIYTNNHTIIENSSFQNITLLLHVSAYNGHLQEGI